MIPSALHRFRQMWFLVSAFVYIVSATAVHAENGLRELTGHLEIITGASPGGGNDRLARSIQRVLATLRLVDVPSSVVNKPGGGNALSWAYLNKHAAQANFIAIANPNLITNHLTGTSPQTWRDFSPLSILLSEYVAIAVRNDSPLKSGRQFLDRLGRDPGSMSIAIGSALGGVNHIALAKLAMAMGADPKKLRPVVFNAMGEAMTAMLGSHVDAVCGSASNMVALARAGRVRILGLTAPQRTEGAFAATPTWREQGADVVVENWRGIIGPRELSKDVIFFWDRTFSTMAKTEAWEERGKAFGLVQRYMSSADMAHFLQSQDADLKVILTELQLAK